MEYNVVGHGDIKHLAVTLDPHEEIYVEKGSLIYFDGGVDPAVFFNGRGLRRILGAKLAGESILILSLQNVSGCPRRVAIAASCGMFAVDIDNEALLCRSGAYIASLDRVDVTSKMSLKGLMGGLGLFMQKISGTTTVFLETKGTPMAIDLSAGEYIVADEEHVIALHGMTHSQIEPKWSVKNLLAGAGLSLLQISGPGRVYLSPASFMNLAETFGNSL